MKTHMTHSQLFLFFSSRFYTVGQSWKCKKMQNANNFNQKVLLLRCKVLMAYTFMFSHFYLDFILKATTLGKMNPITHNDTLRSSTLYMIYTSFFISKIFTRKWASKPQNLKKMLRKSPTSNVWVATFKNTDFPQSSLKVTKLSIF